MFSQQTLLIIGGVAVLAVGLAIFMIYYKYKHPTAKNNKGRDYGTQKAVRVLRRFARSNGYRFLAPVPGAPDAQVDALAVGVFGVIGLKAYGYSGEIYGTPQDKDWLRVGYEDTREYFPNPILEGNRDVQALRSALQKTKARNVPIEVAVVFTNRKAALAVGRGGGVMKNKEWKALLGRDKYQQEKGVDIDKVWQALAGGENGSQKG